MIVLLRRQDCQTILRKVRYKSRSMYCLIPITLINAVSHTQTGKNHTKIVVGIILCCRIMSNASFVFFFFFASTFSMYSNYFQLKPRTVGRGKAMTRQIWHDASTNNRKGLPRTLSHAPIWAWDSTKHYLCTPWKSFGCHWTLSPTSLTSQLSEGDLWKDTIP